MHIGNKLEDQIIGGVNDNCNSAVDYTTLNLVVCTVVVYSTFVRRDGCG